MKERGWGVRLGLRAGAQIAAWTVGLAAVIGWPSGLFAATTEDFQALIVSADNSFLTSEKDLEFASLDARRVAQALVSAGRLPSQQILNLKNPSIDEFDRVLNRVTKKPTEKFLFYFSGHSDENGLHLKDGALTKSKFHDMLSRISSKVKIVILDSCFSGALKSKGVRRERPIELVEYNVDQPTGSVILTSSSDKEFSYESDKLKGSIFTYHLVSGLYGHADSNSDGLVTIDELYQYVYSQTKFQSMVSGGKVQSPEFESKLTGQGALVVSYPSRINGQIRLAANTQGELTLATAKGINFFKFYKNKGETKTLSVPRGQYDVTLVNESQIGSGQIDVRPQETEELDSESLVWEKRQLPNMRAKGLQNKFLFGLTANNHPPFFEGEDGAVMGELFMLSPAGEGLGGRWRLSVHVGGQTHQISGTQEKTEYSRMSIGGQGTFNGWSKLNNEWIVGFRTGTFSTPLPRGTNPGFSSLSQIYVGARFYPENWRTNWDLLIGSDGIRLPNGQDRSVTTVGFAVSF